MRFNRGNSARVFPIYLSRVLGNNYLTYLRVTLRCVLVSPDNSAAYTGRVTPVYLHVVGYR